jgi:hypothetical protein
MELHLGQFHFVAGSLTPGHPRSNLFEPMADRKLTLRPGQSLDIELDVPGGPLRLSLALSSRGLSIGGPVAPEAEDYSFDVPRPPEAMEQDVPSEEYDIIDAGTPDEGEMVVEDEDDISIPSDEIAALPDPESGIPHIGAAMIGSSGAPGNELPSTDDDAGQPAWQDSSGEFRSTARVPKPPGFEAALKATRSYTVFLTPPRTDAAKRAAADIIADVQGIDQESAFELAGKMIVPVARDISERQANTIRDRLREAGLNCRITQRR